MKTKQLMHTLVNLDKKAEELDEVLRNVRSEIHNVLWDLMELKDTEDKNENQSFKKPLIKII